MRDDKLSNEIQKRNIKDLKSVLKQLNKKQEQFSTLITKAKEDILKKQKEISKLEKQESSLKSEFDHQTDQFKTQGSEIFDTCCHKIAISEAQDLDIRRSERKQEEEIKRQEALREKLVEKKRLKETLKKQLETMKLEKSELARGVTLIDKNMTSSAPKAEILKQKVHLTQKLLEDKHGESQETNEDLNHKRDKFNKASNEYYDLKQKMSQAHTARTHATIDIDYSSKKINGLNKKMAKEINQQKINRETLDFLKKECENLQGINESLKIEFRMASSEQMRRKAFDDILATTKIELMKKNIENTITPVVI